MTNREAYLVLNAIDGLGGIRIKRLVEYFGTALKVLAQGKESLGQCRVISPQIVENILQFDKERFLADELEVMRQHQASFVCVEDAQYPALLKAIDDAPAVLYYQGDLNVEAMPTIALVGSRRSSLYGVNLAEQFAVRLAEMGFVIVSGLARGIDAAAHRGALKAKGQTIGVLGCGLAHIYPPEHKDLVKQMSKDGAVISEFPMNTLPVAFNFPRRNRIISGLSLGTVVVEAAEKSGALITAQCALEQGREVFAIPGPIDRLTSFGAHKLIKQGAKLVACVEDILEELAPQLEPIVAKSARSDQPAENRAEVFLSLEEQGLYHLIGAQPVHFDEVVMHYPESVSNASAILMKLETKKLIKQLPGKLFIRNPLPTSV